MVLFGRDQRSYFVLRLRGRASEFANQVIDFGAVLTFAQVC